MNIIKTTLILTSFWSLCTVNMWSQEKTVITNPIIDGHFADPTIVKYEGMYYIYTPPLIHGEVMSLPC
jgi:hypothetical protein